MKRTAARQGAVTYPAKIIKPAPGTIAEVFVAIQGEGILVGERQLFIRLAGCPFRCNYCDTPNAMVPTDFCLVETSPTSRKFRKQPNPVSPESLAAIATSFITADPAIRAIALTGGEPLWQVEYLKAVLPLLRIPGRRIFLETAGAHVAELQEILPFIDVVSMDVKLPSTTGMKPLWAEHQQFLKVALVKQVIVKVVVTRKTMPDELKQVRDMVAQVDRTVPVVLQPATPQWKVKQPATSEQLLLWQALLSEKLEQVRIIPQCHRMLEEL
jgi:organic radical activating enzyme